MSGYKRIPKEIKDEILSRIKQGQKVPQLASEYGVSDKSIYNWLSQGIQAEISTLEFGRLQRERDDLLRLVGNLTLEVEKRKKKRGY
ncbi:MAG: transposase [Patescibacteria group bacterium]